MDSIVSNDLILIPYDIENNIYLLIKVYKYNNSVVSGTIYSKGSGITDPDIIVGNVIDASINSNDVVYRVYDLTNIYIGINL
jgi:hypothetical protein